MGEFKRQFVHALGILLIVPLLFLGRPITALITATIVCILCIWSMYRKKNPYRIGHSKLYENIERFIKDYERHSEVSKIPMKGAITFFVGALLSIILFPEGAAMVAIAVLAIGDSVSTLIGQSFGEHKIPYNNVKSVEGSIAFLAASMIICLVLINPLKALIVCVVATLVESLPRIDDNLSIPLIVGLLLTI